MNTTKSNNGLITKIWGGCGWEFLHSITFGYPLNPTDVQKENYKLFFQQLGHVLPCIYCRESYLEYINSGDTKLTDHVFESRENITYWLYLLHERINKKLDVNYEIEYNDVVKKYESFRANCASSNSNSNKDSQGCVTPLDYKVFSFRYLYNKDSPVIPLILAKKFFHLAKFYDIDNKYCEFIKLAEAVNGDIKKLKKLSTWKIRNILCQKQIKYMRLHGIASVDDDTGLITNDELKLIMFMSSNLSIAELYEIANKFNK